MRVDRWACLLRGAQHRHEKRCDTEELHHSRERVDVPRELVIELARLLRPMAPAAAAAAAERGTGHEGRSVPACSAAM